MMMMSQLGLLILSATIGSAVQSFNTGSTGSDGALVLTVPGTVVFDPSTYHPSFQRESNVFNFTSIYIGPGVTVKLTSAHLTGAVFWLAQGPIDIEGVIDLNGEDGTHGPSVPGAGGYPGGGRQMSGETPPGFTSNAFLIPLVGGDGGAGGKISGGGAGGGALLVASSTSITVNGLVTANGGGSTDGQAGAGGSIRLVAPVIDGNGTLSAKGGQPFGIDGRIRLEASEAAFTGSFNSSPVAQGKPFGLFLPPNAQPVVRVSSIGGIPLSTQEFTLDQQSPVDVLVEARNIPPGTVIELRFYSDEGQQQVITTSPLDGTYDNSHSFVQVTFPRGLSRGYVKASWKEPPGR